MGKMFFPSDIFGSRAKITEGRYASAVKALNRPEAVSRFLMRAAELHRYSVLNVCLLIAQEEGKPFHMVEGADQWKRRGAYLLPGARPLYIWAPRKENGPSRKFGWARVFDVSNTNMRVQPEKEVSSRHVQAVIRRAAEDFDVTIKVGPFRGTKDLEVSSVTGEVRLNQNLLSDDSGLAYNALKGVALCVMAQELSQRKRLEQSASEKAAVACGVGFEVARYLGLNPTALPRAATEILCTKERLEDVHRIAKDIIWRMRDAS